MKFNFKSKKGFTLIELLIVIGILAILAVVAVPVVAGITERANASTDKNNSVEMTGAIKRFTSEYGLFVQDVANGTFNVSDMDAIQNRIYNATGCSARIDITNIESKDGLNGKGVNINTKYPVNEETFKSVVRAYLNSTSTIFEPRQTDKSYYYSPELGFVVLAAEGTPSTQITEIVKTESAYYLNNSKLESGETPSNVQWLNVTLNERLKSDGMPQTNYIVAKEDGTYTTLRNDVETSESQKTINGGSFDSNGNYNQISVDGKLVNATIDNLVKGNYLTLNGGTLGKTQKTKELSGSLVISGNVKKIEDNQYGSGVFQDSNITSITIEDGVEYIGSHAFSNCKNLKYLSIPASVTSIGSNIMMHAGITTLVVDENNKNFTSQDNILFSKDMTILCQSPIGNTISKYTIPSTVKTIKGGAFSSCASFTEITVPDSVTHIGAQAFEACSNLKTTNIPDSTIINDGTVYRGCSSLNNIIINSTNKNYKVVNGCLLSYDGKTLYTICTTSVNIEIPDTVETIETYSICRRNIASITLPVSLKTIKNAGFAGPTLNNFKTLYYKGTEEQFKAINIGHSESGDANKILNTVEKVYNY